MKFNTIYGIQYTIWDIMTADLMATFEPSH